MAKTVCIVPAAGQGKRMGNQLNKQFLCLGRLPILVRTLMALERVESIDEIIVVCRQEEIEYCQQEVVSKYELSKVVSIVAGGVERQQSVYQGLSAISGECDLVLIHDGARPLIEAQIVEEAIYWAKECGAAIVGVPAKDTIKRVDECGFIVDTPPRAALWQVQTPQVFEYSIIIQAYQEAEASGYIGTDDASLVERLGGGIKMVMGSYDNIKITTPEDLEFASAVLNRRELCE